MKRILMTMVCLFSFAISVFCQVENPFQRLRGSLANVITAASFLELVNYKYKDNSVSVWGSLLSEGSSISLSSQYTAGTEYLLIAAPDSDFVDINLTITDGSGNIIQKDYSRDSVSMITFIPSTTSFYTFQMTNNSSTASLCSIVILEESGGYGDFSVDEIVESLNTVLYLAEVVGLFDTIIPVNKFCLFGGKLDNGTGNSVYDISLSDGYYVYLGAGSSNVYSLTLDAKRQYSIGSSSGNSVFSSDISDESYDLGVFEVDDSYKYSFSLNNTSSMTTSAFMFGFLLMM